MANQAPEVRVLASSSTWIEGEAVRQLERSAALGGMRLVVGMPDLHPGKGHPIGAVFGSEGLIHPYLVGNDIGCGMGLWRTDLLVRKARQSKMVKRLRSLDGPWDGDPALWLEEHGVEPGGADDALGTIGGGNHFAEIQAVQEVHDPQALADLGIEPDRLLLLVHSGSRGIGHAVLQRQLADDHAFELEADSEEGRDYLTRHDRAHAWAVANRALVAHRVLGRIGAGGERVLDLGHNAVQPSDITGRPGWLHRKGATPSDCGPAVVPGSRGSLSFLVMPTGDHVVNARSLPHGAGRKWSRSDSRARLERRFKASDLTRTKYGSRVICEDKALLYEEAPQAYKDVESVVGDLVDEGVAHIVASMRPVITYKKGTR